MKILCFLPAFIFCAGFNIQSANATITKGDNPMEMVKNIQWLGQSAVKITAGEKIIYIDPFHIMQSDKADIILITHSHSDHFSPSDIKKIATEDTVIIATKDCSSKLAGIENARILESEPGFKTSVNDIRIEAVPAYNVIKTNFHPKANKWVGYIITVDGVRIYHAGDTERIPEMKTFECDIAMLPLGQTYTMNSVREAADAACDVKAKIAIPIHYGMYEGTSADAEKFKDLLKDKVNVVIKQENK